MIRHSMQTSELRFFSEVTEDPFAPYDVICTLLWETATVVWIRGMKGDLTLKMFRELVQFCVDSGIATVKAHRAPTRRLPFGRLVGDHYEIAIAEAAGRR